ncbi:MAG TPA: glycosyl hydrolase family 43 [bacterium]|nr:glycosyl hydrolase family 43 [bacterium]
MDLKRKWKQHPSNPIIKPPFYTWLIGDPVVLLPDEGPDGLWHLFLNTVLFVHHYTSDDGIKWKREFLPACRGMRAFILPWDGVYYLFNEVHASINKSVIKVRSSFDLKSWHDEKTLITPEYDWETKPFSTVSCPCVIWTGQKFRMYYSTNGVFLKDMGFCEPLNIGIAESDFITGPYVKNIEPFMVPDENDPWMNRGCGSIKVYPDEENNRFVAFNNGIYADGKGRSGSAIRVMTSSDGLDWKLESEEPIVKPDRGWRKGHVYAMDVKQVGDELWMYYNARDGWRIGWERVGLEIGTKI